LQTGDILEISLVPGRELIILKKNRTNAFQNYWTPDAEIHSTDPPSPAEFRPSVVFKRIRVPIGDETPQGKRRHESAKTYQCVGRIHNKPSKFCSFELVMNETKNVENWLRITT
tara:strand:- start:82 stop:423 length:342 start_codon:yes stop_codon:yes gene_type:complete